jgi:GNAT superfamily N-acetyltransferase
MIRHRNALSPDHLFDEKSGLYFKWLAALAEDNFLPSIFALNGNIIANRNGSSIPNKPLFASTTNIHLFRDGLDKRPSFFCVRPFSNADRASVFELLSILPTLYPKGTNWLDRRLNDVLFGKARCTLAVTAWGQPIGVTIETPKEAYRLKLSTIYVHPAFRGLGIGTALLSNCYTVWLREELRQVYVTAASHVSETLYSSIRQFGFCVKAVAPNRYGIDRDEIVFDWLPERI